jgi:hypothetical protein
MKGIYFVIILTIISLSCQNRSEEKTTSKNKVTQNLNPQLEFPSPIPIKTPNFEGNVLPSKSKNFLTLKFSSKKENQIIDDEDWFIDNQISLPTYTVYNEFRNIRGNLPTSIPIKYNDYIITDGFKYNTYNIFFYGVNFGEKRFAIITDKKNTKIEHFLDFDNFNSAPKTLEGDENYVFQSIKWSIIENNVLFISHGHSTYAKSTFGKNAYISAIDLETYEIIWTTEPLTCNSTFIIVNNSIICGYGFTAETDYIFVLDKNTGSRIQKIKIDKGPSYIIQKENKILARTYDQDYEFDIK